MVQQSITVTNLNNIIKARQQYSDLSKGYSEYTTIPGETAIETCVSGLSEAIILNGEKSSSTLYAHTWESTPVI